MIKLNNTPVPQNKFPDGTLLMKYTELYFPKHNVIDWKYENDGELFTLFCLTRHLQEHRPNCTIALIVDYLPHARMDRVKSNEDIFTLKYFCEIINSLNFNKVIVEDVHSNVSLALLDRVVERKPIASINNVLQQVPTTGRELIAFYPDEGAMKRYQDWIDSPYAFGIKKRNWSTGTIEGLDIVGDVEGRDILIIDDICSKGGTFYHSAKKLKELGAKDIYLYVTHCEDTIFEGELLKNNDLIKHIFTTDSLITREHEKITIV